MSRQWPVAYGKRERMGGNGREEGQCNSVGLEVGGGRRRRESDDSVTNTEFTVRSIERCQFFPRF